MKCIYQFTRCCITLEEGSSRTTADGQVNAGLRRVHNQSKYFAYNGDRIAPTQWHIGNNSYDPQNIDEVPSL